MDGWVGWMMDGWVDQCRHHFNQGFELQVVVPDVSRAYRLRLMFSRSKKASLIDFHIQHGHHHSTALILKLEPLAIRYFSDPFTTKFKEKMVIN